MVIRGNSRGNGRALATYLLAKKDNEAIRILDIDGQFYPKAADLHKALFEMDISNELSKSQKGLYHAQINPAIGEDALMNNEHWLQASDILGRQLGLTNQRRAIVLHTKKGRTHAHVVWERFDYDKGKMVSDSFSRLAQDRARKEMELVFGHKQTPHRNKHRPELKASLLNLWNQTATGGQFVKAAKDNGYLIAEGSGRSPYVVVDEFARSYDLTRQLQGIRLKDVRHRLRNETLLGEKDAIVKARNAINDGSTEEEKGTNSTSIKLKTVEKELKDNSSSITGQQTTSEKFGNNKTDLGNKTSEKTETEQRKEAFKKAMKQVQEKNTKGKDLGMGID